MIASAVLQPLGRIPHVVAGIVGDVWTEAAAADTSQTQDRLRQEVLEYFVRPGRYYSFRAPGCDEPGRAQQESARPVEVLQFVYVAGMVNKQLRLVKLAGRVPRIIPAVVPTIHNVPRS